MKSTAWFDRGADAVQRVVSGFPRGYVCPLCLRHFPPEQIDVLTVDHVPAEQLGGTRMVLTCNACNHSSGSFIQGEMKKREDAHDAFTGPVGEPHPVTITLSTGAIVRGEMRREGDRYLLSVLPANSPEAMQRLRDEMNHLTATKSTDWSVNVDLYQYAYDQVSAHVGWLREAYLVAFAVFGYRYILDPALEPVRQQLATARETDFHIQSRGS